MKKKDFSALSELMKAGLGQDMAFHRHDNETPEERQAIGDMMGEANRRIWDEMSKARRLEEGRERSRRKDVARLNKQLMEARNKVDREHIQKQLDRHEKYRLDRKARLKAEREARKTGKTRELPVPKSRK